MKPGNRGDAEIARNARERVLKEPRKHLLLCPSLRSLRPLAFCGSPGLSPSFSKGLKETESFTETMRRECARIWEAQLTHPFVVALADGTLPQETFRFYILQDARFLTELAKDFRFCRTKTDDRDRILHFGEYLIDTIRWSGRCTRCTAPLRHDDRRRWLLCRWPQRTTPTHATALHCRDGIARGGGHGDAPVCVDLRVVGAHFNRAYRQGAPGPRWITRTGTGSPPTRARISSGRGMAARRPG